MSLNKHAARAVAARAEALPILAEDAMQIAAGKKYRARAEPPLLPKECPSFPRRGWGGSAGVVRGGVADQRRLFAEMFPKPRNLNNIIHIGQYNKTAAFEKPPPYGSVAKCRENYGSVTDLMFE